VNAVRLATSTVAPVSIVEGRHAALM